MQVSGGKCYTDLKQILNSFVVKHTNAGLHRYISCLKQGMIASSSQLG